MNVTLRIDGRDHLLHLERSGETWNADGREASVLEVEPGIYSVLIEGSSYEARIERVEDTWAVTIGRQRFVIEVADPRRRSRGRRAVESTGRQEITSPMPGKIVRVLVGENESVEAGQGIVVVEAMKMQNELRAARAGRALALAAKEGATVAAGEVLAVIGE